MSNRIFSKLLDDRIETLKNNLENLITSNNDPIMIGKLTEAYFNNAIKDFLPNHIEMTNGWIHDEKEFKGHERDIIIYDTTKAPAFLVSAGSGIVPLCSVLYDIQIKKSLGKQSIHEASKKFIDGRHFNGLLSLNGKRLLHDYIETDSTVCFKPKIKILSSEQDGLYYFIVFKTRYSELYTDKMFIKEIAEEFIKNNPRAAKQDLLIRAFNINRQLENMYFTTCEWRKYSSSSNLKGFAVFLLRQFYREDIYKYITEDPLVEKTISRTILEHEGNIIYGPKINHEKNGVEEKLSNILRNIKIACDFDKKGNVRLSATMKK